MITIFDPMNMVPMPTNVPGPDDDLNEKLDGIMQRALADEESILFDSRQETVTLLNTSNRDIDLRGVESG